MKLVAKYYKDIENNENNNFAQDIMYIDNISLIGFGAATTKNNNTDDSNFGYIYIDIAARLDDLRSIIKLVLMYGVSKQELHNFIDSALAMPDRGITGYCPVMVAVSDNFIKDKDEYYIYAVNGRKDEDNNIYTLSFDTISMTKIYYIISLVKQRVYNKIDLNYFKLDYYERLNKVNTKLINLAFTNKYEMIGFVAPQKKLFETKFNCLCLAYFKHNRNIYYIYFNTLCHKEDRKKLRSSPYNDNQTLLDQIDDSRSFIVQNSIDVSYYNKGATELMKKVMMFGTRRDNNENICFIFSEENYKTFTDSVGKFMRE